MSRNLRREQRRRRLMRQFLTIGRRFPATAGLIDWMMADRSRLYRIPLAFLLIFGGLLAFLPVLGLWMLPLGLMLLALDLPFLQGPVAHLIIRLRRRYPRLLRRRRN